MTTPRVGVLAGVLVAYGGLLVLAWKLRQATSSGSGTTTKSTDRYLRRTDLLDEGKPPEDPLEWVIATSQRPRFLAGLVVGSVLVALLAGAAGRPELAGLAGYFAVLALVMVLLSSGWNRLESRIDTDFDVSRDDGPRVNPDTLPGWTGLRIAGRKDPPSRRTAGELGVGDAKITVIIGSIVLVVLAASIYTLEALG